MLTSAHCHVCVYACVLLEIGQGGDQVARVPRHVRLPSRGEEGWRYIHVLNNTQSCSLTISHRLCPTIQALFSLSRCYYFFTVNDNFPFAELAAVASSRAAASKSLRVSVPAREHVYLAVSVCAYVTRPLAQEEGLFVCLFLTIQRASRRAQDCSHRACRSCRQTEARLR